MWPPARLKVQVETLKYNLIIHSLVLYSHDSKMAIYA